MPATQFAQPSSPVLRENRKAKLLPKFEMPEIGQDKLHVYVTTFQKDSPFSEKHIGGVSFFRYTLPSDWSLRKNADKTHFPQIPTVMLTEKQAEAIIERSKLVQEKTPRIENEDGITPAKACTLYEHILLEKAEIYAQNAFEMPSPVIPNLEKDQNQGFSKDDIKDELTNQQKTKKGKR